MSRALSKESKAKIEAGIALIRRTGSTQFQLRYHDEEQPLVWIAVAAHPGRAPRFEAAASTDPVRAVLRLCEQLIDGGLCTHCHRPSGLEPDSLDTMPLNRTICWYQFDPENATFRRGCEGDAP